MDPKEIKKNKKVYIDMIIDISTHLSYNELTYIEQKGFVINYLDPLLLI